MLEVIGRMRDMLGNVSFDFITYLPMKVGIYWLTTLFIVLITGTVIAYVVNFDKSLEFCYITGCVFWIAVSQVVARLSILLERSFVFYVVSTCVVAGLILVIFASNVIKNKVYIDIVDNIKKCFVKLKKLTRIELILVFILVALGVIILLNAVGLGFYGQDDGYYVTKVGMIIKENKLDISFTLAANGIDECVSFNRADVSSWSIFLAMNAFLARVHYAIFCHFAIVPFIVFAFFATISLISKKLCKSTSQYLLYCITFLIITMTIPIWGTMLQEVWVISYSWYGISVLNVFILFLIYLIYCAWINKDCCTNNFFWIYVSMVVIASIATEVVAVFLIPCLLFAYGIPYLIKYRKNITWVLMARITLILIPIAIFAILLLIQVYNMPETAKVLNGIASNESAGFGNDIKKGLLDEWYKYGSYYWLLRANNIYPLATFLALILVNNRDAKTFFGGAIIVELLTFLNPLFCRFIGENISTFEVYYRLYWCIPNSVIITYWLAEKFVNNREAQYKRVVLYCSMILLIFMSCGSVFFDVLPAVNCQKVPEDYRKISEEINKERKGEDIKVVLPVEICDYVRQCSLNIQYTVGPRSSNSIIQGSDIQYNQLYLDLYKKEHVITKNEIEILKRLGTEIIVYNENYELPECFKDKVYDKCYGYVFVKL